MFPLLQNNNVALTVTLCHLLLKFILAGIIRSIWECKTEKQRVTVGWGTYIKRIALAGTYNKIYIREIDKKEINLNFWCISYNFFLSCRPL